MANPIAPYFAPLLERPDLVRAEFKRVPRSVIIFAISLVAAVALAAIGFVFWDELQEIGAASRSRRGRAIAIVPYMLAVISLGTALLYSRRAFRGEYTFTFAPTGEALNMYLAYGFKGTPENVQGLVEGFRSGDPRNYTPLAAGAGTNVQGQILIAKNSRAAIATTGWVQRRGSFGGEPVLMHGANYDRLTIPNRKALRTGKLSKRDIERLDATYAQQPQHPNHPQQGFPPQQ